LAPEVELLALILSQIASAADQELNRVARVRPAIPDAFSAGVFLGAGWHVGNDNVTYTRIDGLGSERDFERTGNVSRRLSHRISDLEPRRGGLRRTCHRLRQRGARRRHRQLRAVGSIGAKWTFYTTSPSRMG